MEVFDAIYKVNASYDISKNERILNDIYLPIIGKDAISLYNEFILLANNIHNSFKNTHSDLIRKYNLTKDEFIDIRKKLEAIGLLKTYYDEISKEYTYYLYSNLSYTEFMNNEKLRAVLLKKIGDNGIKKLYYKYENNFQPANNINLSEGILYLLDDENEKMFRFNFNKLNLDILSRVNSVIDINFETKEYIEQIYLEHSFDYNEILDLCISTVDIQYKTINLLALCTKFDCLLKEKRKQEIQINTKINRKKELFFSDKLIDDYEKVIEDYRRFSSDNYLVSLTKEKLTNSRINFLNKLRQEFELEDYQINVIIDFTLFKNNGKFVEPYIKKICMDVWQNDITNISDIINKLRASIIGYNTSNKHIHTITPISNPTEKIDKTTHSDVLEILRIAGL